MDDGQHLLQVVIERAGSSADVVSTGASVTVANTDEPSLSFSIVESGSIVRGNIHIQATPANVGGDPVIAVRYEVGAAVIAQSASPNLGLSALWRTVFYADGTYRVRVLAELASGRVLRAPDLILTTRNVRGWIALPTEGATVSGTVSLRGRLGCDSECFFTTATYLMDGAVLPGDSLSGIPWDSTTVPNGSHELRIVYRLRDGRVVRLGPRTFTVSN